MPCYTVSPAYRRNLVHYNPFFHGSPQGPLTTTYPRYSSPSFLQSFQEDLAQFDNFFREVDEKLSAIRKSPQSFQPKFDIQEENGNFVLTGELPGVKAEDLKVEFVSKNTLLVEGRIVREETQGETPAVAPETEAEKAEIESAPAAEAKQDQDQNEDDVTMSGALPEQSSDSASTTTSTTQNYHKASVEDEDTGETPASQEQQQQQQQQQVVKPTAEQDISKSTSEQQQQQPHYWVSERTVGEFRRVFRFPGRVDQDAVKASLKDGILTVAVPKVAAEQEGNRRIKVDA